MVSKSIIGWMLILGPIAAAILIFLEPRASSEVFADSLQVKLDNLTLARVTAIGFSVALSIIFIGTIFFARSMAEAQKPGSSLAAIGSLLALFSAVAFSISSAIHLVVLQPSFVANGGNTVQTYAISEAIFNGTFLISGSYLLLIGIAIVKQQTLNQIAGWITALFGICLIIGAVLPSDDPSLETTTTLAAIGGIIWFIGFLGWPIITLVLGILVLRSTD
tara:strand:- start:9637 stop:10296 length:660 start_codon:yes stop_codon:yes gene_type:complete